MFWAGFADSDEVRMGVEVVFYAVRKVVFTDVFLCTPVVAVLAQFTWRAE